MKKIFLLFTVLSMVFTSCDPLEDIHEEIDAATVTVGNDTHTLSSDDYESLGLESSYFVDIDAAKSLIPGFLLDNYSYLGKESSIIVNYELKSGTDISKVEGTKVDAYISAESYNLDNSDYPSAAENATGFYETETATEYLPAILEANFSGSEEGDVVLTKYNQYIGETVNGITEFYTVDFSVAGSLLDYTAVNVSGDQVWEGTTYGAKMTGYSGGSQNPNEDWLISPDIDLNNFPNATFETTQIFNYGDPSSYSILISTDYTDDISAATWDVIELTSVPDGTSWAAVTSEAYSLSAYNGETINIAFKYISTDSDAGTYEIVDVSLKAPGVEGETKYEEVYYTFSGSEWQLSEGVYYLTSADYDSMGEESNQPGKYNNFSSSVEPNNYIPSYLAQKYPYAQEGDTSFILFKYYDGGTYVRANEYMYTDGNWEAHQTQLQYVNSGEVWEPIIKYTLTSEDYELVGNGYYNNFDVREGKDEETDEARLAKINTILLNNFSSDDEEGQKYLILYNVYSGADEVWSMSVIKSGGEYILD
jgi:hypothetical protein